MGSHSPGQPCWHRLFILGLGAGLQRCGWGGCLGGAEKQNPLSFVWQVWESVPYLASYISPLLKENRAIPLDPGQLETTWNGPCSSGVGERERAAWESGRAPPVSLEGWPLPGAEEGQGLGAGRPRAGTQGAPRSLAEVEMLSPDSRGGECPGLQLALHFRQCCSFCLAMLRPRQRRSSG